MKKIILLSVSAMFLYCPLGYAKDKILDTVKSYIPGVEEAEIKANNFEQLYGYYDDKPFSFNLGQLSGEQMYLFPDHTYFYLEWADIWPLTIHDKGRWSYEKGRVKLFSDGSMKDDDAPRDLAFIPLKYKNGSEEMLLLMGTRREYAYFKDNIRDKHGKVDEFILELTTLNKKKALSSENYKDVKEQIYQEAWHPENFEEMEITEKNCAEMFGGVWGRFGELQEERCNLRSADAGKVCGDSDDCRLGACIAEITKEEEQELLKGKVLSRNGKCSEFELNFGCFPLVEDGKIDGLFCQE